MSSSRLCVASWNCSRLFLFTCGERSTVKIFLRVGKGIGPVTTAPVLRTVFTIFSADLSTRLWSYDCNLIRILCDICRFPFFEWDRKGNGCRSNRQNFVFFFSQTNG